MLSRDVQDAQGSDGGAACPGHVQVGHQRELGHRRLLGAQRRVLANLAQEPVAELGRRLDDTATHEVGQRIGEVGGRGEEATERHRLLREDAPRQRVTRLTVAADRLGGPCERQLRERMVGMAGQPVGEQVAPDPRQRGDALDVARLPAAAGRDRLAVVQDAVEGNSNVPELAGLAGRAANHRPRLDHPAAEPGAHHRGDRRSQRRALPEMQVMRVQGSGIAIVVVDHRATDARLQRGSNVEPTPLGLREVRRAQRADDAIGARRTRRIEPDGGDVCERRPCRIEGKVHGRHHRLDRHPRPIGHAARDLVHAVDEVAAVHGQDGCVVLGGAVVDPDHHLAV